MNPHRPRPSTASDSADSLTRREGEASLPATRRTSPGDGRLSGAALIIVLAILVIVTGIVVAFLSSISHETAGTAAASTAITTRNLADSAIQLTIAQIRDATDGSDTNGNLTGWASQPGAIRVFSTTNNGTAVVFKLYSSDTLRSPDGFNPSNDLAPAGWWTNPGVWVDLNSPVSNSVLKTNIYPIMDPGLAMYDPTTGATNSNNYVDGFYIQTNLSQNPGYYSNSPAAMPVEWLYMLRNGTLIAPDATSTPTNTTFTNVANSANRPSQTNPIVGRIAFWADDETCKLNINTASEGVPWDPPTFMSLEDVGFQNYAPAGNEYNRFLGHPASVCLSPVLWSYCGWNNPDQLIWSTPPNPVSICGTTNPPVWRDMPPVPSPLLSNVATSPTNYVNILFGNTNTTNNGVLPRTFRATNGSFFGTVSLYSTTNATNSIYSGANRGKYSSQPIRTDRLYATVDEMNFRATNNIASGRTNNTALLSPQTIAKLRFFLTAQSRAPQVNLFNLPRVCLWPENDTNNANTVNPNFKLSDPRSLLDSSIAFASTLGTNPYYFTRYDPTDPTNDFVNIPRNQQLYRYIYNLLGTGVPGYASSSNTSVSYLTGKSTKMGYQITTLCFDYIRSCINLVDSYGSGTTTTDPTNVATGATNHRYAYSYTVPPTNFTTAEIGQTNYSGFFGDDYTNSTGLGQTLPPGCAQVVPIAIYTNSGGATYYARGQGRFPILKSASLVFYAVAADHPPVLIDTNTRKPVGSPPYTVNHMHPFPINHRFNTNNGWEGGPNTLSNFADPNWCYANLFNRDTTKGGQYPCLYPTNFGLMPAFVDGVTRGVTTNTSPPPTTYTLTNDWVGAIITNITAFTGTTVTNTNSFQFGTTNGITNAGTGMPNADALTITHAGLVYGGDLDTVTGAFDCYNVYFSNIAAMTPIGTTTGKFDYIRQISYSSTNVGTPLTSATVTSVTNTNTVTVSIPNVDSPLFPKPYQTLMQPVLILDHGLTTPGFPPYSPNFKVVVKGLNNLQADGQDLWPGGDYGQYYTNLLAGSGMYGLGSPDMGPNLFGMSTMLNASGNMTNGVDANVWPFVGNFVLAKSNTAAPDYGATFQFGGGTISLVYLKPTASMTAYTSNDIIQTVNICFPDSTFPTPKLRVLNQSYSSGPLITHNAPFYFADWTKLAYFFKINMSTNDDTNNMPVNFINPKYLLPNNLFGTNLIFNNYYSAPASLFVRDLDFLNNYQYSTANTIRSMEVAYGDWRIPAMLYNVPAGSQTYTPKTWGYGYSFTSMGTPYIPHVLYFASIPETNHANGLGNFPQYYWRSAHSIRGNGGNPQYSGHNYATFDGAFQQTFIPNSGYTLSGVNLFAGNFTYPSKTDSQVNVTVGNTTTAYNSRSYSYASRGNIPEALSTVDFAGFVTSSSAANNFTNLWSKAGDFDNPIGGTIMDGPYINKVDEGTVGWIDMTGAAAGIGAGYNGSFPTWASVGRARFSPNRMVPSAGIFCSLTSGFDPSGSSFASAWKSLLFCPNPNSSNRIASMTGLPDYMIMDLFDMPVVQPYPIGEPYSTAGRVNLNYQIAPFSYIHRDSALRGVMKSVDIIAVPESAQTYYKNGTSQPDPWSDIDYSGLNSATFNGSNSYYSYHYPVHLDQTLSQFDYKFSTNGFFRVGAEICSMWLYPAQCPNNGDSPSSIVSTYVTNTRGLADPSLANDINGITTNIFNWWYSGAGTTRKGLTGMNSRARPYTGIYANITTKSNTYQIHYRVQTLKQTAGAHPTASSWANWVEPGSGGMTDKILGEQRGSATIERYIDPSNLALPDFTTNVKSGGGINTSAPTMDSYYQFRVFNAKQFTP